MNLRGSTRAAETMPQSGKKCIALTLAIVLPLILTGCASNGGYTGAFAYGKRDANGVSVAYSTYNSRSTIATEAAAHCKTYGKVARLLSCGPVLLVCDYACVDEIKTSAPSIAAIVDRDPSSSTAVTTSGGTKMRWNAKSIASSPSGSVALADQSGQVIREVRTADIQNYIEIEKAIKDASGIDADLQLVDDSTVNAFAGYADKKPTVAVTFGLLDAVNPTDAEFAALLGHEFAHFALRHYESNQQRGAALNVVSLIAGTALEVAGVPLGGSATDLVVSLIDTKFSREQEQAADKLGMAIAHKAGYSEYAAVTLQEKLKAASNMVSIPFLSTHPSSDDRIAYLKTLSSGVPH